MTDLPLVGMLEGRVGGWGAVRGKFQTWVREYDHALEIGKFGSRFRLAEKDNELCFGHVLAT